MDRSPDAATKRFALPKIDVETVPYSGSAIRATAFAIEFDGGSLLLRVFENRENPSPRSTYVATKRQHVEIAKFAISAVALQALDAAVQQAKHSWAVAMGHELPDNGKLIAALTGLAQQAYDEPSDVQAKHGLQTASETTITESSDPLATRQKRSRKTPVR